MACDHCDNSYAVESIKDSTKDDAKSTSWFETYIYVCPSCGGELAADSKNDAIGFCPYCDGASMLYDRVREDWKPDYIIPFKVTKEGCKNAYLKEVRKNPFISGKYRKKRLIESFRGIYMPYWYYEGQQKGEYAVSYSVSESSSTQVKTTVYEQHYHADYRLNGCTHDASLNFDDHISERLDPYHSGQRKKFHPGYMAGFYAEIGDVEPEENEELMVAMMQDYTAEKIADFNNTKQRVNLPTKVSSMERTMHPVWFMSYRNKGKLTYAAVNGETGKVAADLPLSPLRILFAALLAAALIFGVIFGLMSALPSIKANATLAACSLLSFAGAYFLQMSYLGTVRQSLQLSGVELTNKYFQIIFGISTGVSVIAALMIANDGSYYQARAIFGWILLIPAFIYAMVMIIWQFSLSIELKNNLRTVRKSQLENGIIIAAKKYSVLFLILYIIIMLTAFVFLLISTGDSLSKLLYYILCGVLAAMLFIIALLHIRFQTKVAKRRPPQMDKKGALYDEK